MQEIIIIAGPNGAGKTTFARQLLRGDARLFVFLNADEIRRREECSEIAAGRMLLSRLDTSVAKGRNVAFETTLSGTTYLRKLDGWRSRGVRVTLYYIGLPDAAVSRARVAQRVAMGGHGINADLDQRFVRSLANLTRFKDAVDVWYVYLSEAGRFTELERSIPHG
jgi:predicted ABC-type ATPase